MGKEELQWLSEHSKEVEKYSGKWIVFTAKHGIVASATSAKDAFNASKTKGIKSPSIFKVPRKDENEFVLIVVK